MIIALHLVLSELQVTKLFQVGLVLDGNFEVLQIDYEHLCLVPENHQCAVDVEPHKRLRGDGRDVEAVCLGLTLELDESPTGS